MYIRGGCISGEEKNKTPLFCVVGSCFYSFVSGFGWSLEVKYLSWRLRRKKRKTPQPG